MKIDKGFMVKVDGKTFTANEISSISFDIAWFRMNCISNSGTRFIVEASLNDVEFLSIPREPSKDVIEVVARNAHGEEIRGKVTTSRNCRCQAIPYLHHEDMEPKAPNEVVKRAVREAMAEYENKPVTETELSRLEARKRLERDYGEATKKWSEAMNSLQTDLAYWSEKTSEIFKSLNHDWW